MDRCALFVDAGYALGDGALAVHGTRNRDSVTWDYAGLLKLLSSLSRDRTGLPLLRCYWYDVAAPGSRVSEHDVLADLPGVKLRLSRARSSRREGVEAELRRDLTGLARNRSVTDVIVVSAEEDLAPVIAEVQEFGLRVLLLHIGMDGSWSGSRALLQECDEVIEISPAHLRPYVDLISGAEPQRPGNSYRELPAAARASGPHPVLETSGSRLLDPPAPTGYERAAELPPAGGQVGAPDAGYGQAAYGGPRGAHSANGHNGGGRAHDFQPGVPADGRAHGAAAVAPALPRGADQPNPGLAHPQESAGLVAHSPAGAPTSGNGVPASGGYANGVPPSGVPANGAPPGDPGAVSQSGYLGTGPGGPQHQLPGQQPDPMSAHGLGQSESFLPSSGAAGPGGGQHGARGLAGQQNSLMPLDAQRPPLPQRQLPAGNGMPYGQDRGTAYPAQLPGLPQFGGPVGEQPYGSGPYGAPPPSVPPPSSALPPSVPPPSALPPSALPPSVPPPGAAPQAQQAVAEAVESAHAEGFGFGEAVARDAPALWLEAVLARKPRMPSDLEARLLQGSALPIDSLLHDEVRHALRRGFWDALERSRH